MPLPSTCSGAVELATRVAAEICRRCDFGNLRAVASEAKEDNSPVTQIDGMIEGIVIEHLAPLLPNCAWVREEEDGRRQTIRELKAAEYLVTIDGIDGTSDFLRHINAREPNSRWLAGLTAVYRRNGAGRFDPVLSFALQVNENRLFVAAGGEALLVWAPLGNARAYKLSADNVSSSLMRGSIDVFLDKPGRLFKLREQGLAAQRGPSGFNFASLASACAPPEAEAGCTEINFTTFHYNVWDLGLWPVLQEAGIKTAIRRPDGQCMPVTALDLDWFGLDHELPGKCAATPLVLSRDAGFDPLVADD